MRHIGTRYTRENETHQHLQQILDHWATHGFGIWVMLLRDSGRFAGRCGLQHLRPSDRSSSAMPSAGPPGDGAQPRAGQASLDFGFSTLALPRIIATVRSANARSHRVLEKLGMRPAGQRERYGHLVDQFAIERAELRAALPT